MSKATYYSYIRFSTPDQLKGDSLRRQLDAARAYVEQQGGILDESKTFKDLGVSAFRGKNARAGSRLGEFLAAVAAGHIKPGSFLVVEAIDRISRNAPMEQLELILKIIRAGISMVTLFDKKVYSREILNNDVSASLYLQILISRGHEESKTKSQRLQKKWEFLRSKNAPITGKCPAWLRLITKDGRKEFQKLEDRCRLIKEIFEKSACGLGKISIAKSLNGRGVPSWGTGKGGNKGAATGWHPSYIHKVLHSRAVLGEFQPHKLIEGKRVAVGEPKQGYFPPIITQELFLRVHGQRKKNAKFAGRTGDSVRNLFSNIARCGYCGSAIHLKRHGRKHPDWEYLVCYHANRGIPCIASGWAYHDFEASFLAFITELDFATISGSENLEKLTALEMSLALAEGQRDETSERRAEAKRLAKEKPTKTIFDALCELDAEVESFEKRVAELSAQIAQERQAVRERNSKAFNPDVVLSKLSDPEFRSRLRLEIRKRITRIDVFSKGINGKADAKRRCFWVTFDTGEQKRVQPTYGNPTNYQVLSITSKKPWNLPLHTHWQPAQVFVSDDGLTTELVATSQEEINCKVMDCEMELEGE
jgi:DNA invertase Pin-like site-specific DNA recombinase